MLRNTLLHCRKICPATASAATPSNDALSALIRFTAFAMTAI